MARNYFATETNLDWELKRETIQVNGNSIDSHFALTRSDSGKVLQLHKNSYVPFFNSDFKRLLEDMQKITGFENLKYQEFKDGNIILGYLKNDKDEISVNGFRIDKYMVLGDTRDGSKGTFLGKCEEMIRCLNQYGSIIKSNIIKHTKNSYHRLDELKMAYEQYFMELEAQEKLFKSLSEISIDKNLMESLTKRLFDVKENEEISIRKSNQMFEFGNSLAKETADLGKNAFGFFHATTHYTTHVLKGENVVGNLFGTANAMNQKALNLVSELV